MTMSEWCKHQGYKRMFKKSLAAALRSTSQIKSKPEKDNTERKDSIAPENAAENDKQDKVITNSLRNIGSLETEYSVHKTAFKHGRGRGRRRNQDHNFQVSLTCSTVKTEPMNSSNTDHHSNASTLADVCPVLTVTTDEAKSSSSDTLPATLLGKETTEMIAADTKEIVKSLQQPVNVQLGITDNVHGSSLKKEGALSMMKPGVFSSTSLLKSENTPEGDKNNSLNMDVNKAVRKSYASDLVNNGRLEIKPKKDYEYCKKNQIEPKKYQKTHNFHSMCNHNTVPNVDPCTARSDQFLNLEGRKCTQKGLLNPPESAKSHQHHFENHGSSGKFWNKPSVNFQRFSRAPHASLSFPSRKVDNSFRMSQRCKVKMQDGELNTKSFSKFVETANPRERNTYANSLAHPSRESVAGYNRHSSTNVKKMTDYQGLKKASPIQSSITTLNGEDWKSEGNPKEHDSKMASSKAKAVSCNTPTETENLVNSQELHQNEVRMENAAKNMALPNNELASRASSEILVQAEEEISKHCENFQSAQSVNETIATFYKNFNKNADLKTQAATVSPFSVEKTISIENIFAEILPDMHSEHVIHTRFPAQDTEDSAEPKVYIENKPALINSDEEVANVCEDIMSTEYERYDMLTPYDNCKSANCDDDLAAEKCSRYSKKDYENDMVLGMISKEENSPYITSDLENMSPSISLSSALVEKTNNETPLIESNHTSDICSKSSTENVMSDNSEMSSECEPDLCSQSDGGERHSNRHGSQYKQDRFHVDPHYHSYKRPSYVCPYPPVSQRDCIYHEQMPFMNPPHMLYQTSQFVRRNHLRNHQQGLNSCFQPRKLHLPAEMIASEKVKNTIDIFLESCSADIFEHVQNLKKNHPQLDAGIVVSVSAFPPHLFSMVIPSQHQPFHPTSDSGVSEENISHSPSPSPSSSSLHPSPLSYWDWGPWSQWYSHNMGTCTSNIPYSYPGYFDLFLPPPPPPPPHNRDCNAQKRMELPHDGHFSPWMYSYWGLDASASHSEDLQGLAYPSFLSPNPYVHQRGKMSSDCSKLEFYCPPQDCTRARLQKNQGVPREARRITPTDKACLSETTAHNCIEQTSLSGTKKCRWNHDDQSESSSTDSCVCIEKAASQSLSKSSVLIATNRKSNVSKAVSSFLTPDLLKNEWESNTSLAKKRLDCTQSYHASTGRHRTFHLADTLKDPTVSSVKTSVNATDTSLSSWHTFSHSSGSVQGQAVNAAYFGLQRGESQAYRRKSSKISHGCSSEGADSVNTATPTKSPALAHKLKLGGSDLANRKDCFTQYHRHSLGSRIQEKNVDAYSPLVKSRSGAMSQNSKLDRSEVAERACDSTLEAGAQSSSPLSFCGGMANSRLSHESVSSSPSEVFNGSWASRLVSRSRMYKYTFIDSHCHIDFLYSRLELLTPVPFSQFQEAHADCFPVNYEGCIAVFCNPKTFAAENPKDSVVKTLANENGIWFAFGCHPKNALEFSDSHMESLRYMLMLMKHKVVALGEIGLDYSGMFHQHAEVQKFVFRQQLKLALELKLPLIIHCRDADDDCLEILCENVPCDYKIHAHCFTRDFTVAERWLKPFPNLFLGLTPLITYKSVVDAANTATYIPLQRLLLETDAPYFVPTGYYNKALRYSHPGFALCTAERVAVLKGVSVDEVLKACRENTRTMYGI